MRRRLAGATVVLLGTGALLGASASAFTLEAQQSVQVAGPPGNPISTLTPSFTIAAQGFSLAQQPVTLRFQVATNAQFANPLLDTTLVGENAVVTMPRALPDGASVFWRATASGSDGASVTSATTGPRAIPPWLALVSPNVATGVTLDTPRPTFVWSSAPVDAPPGPWTYTFDLLRSNSPFPAYTAQGLTDTTFTPGFDLDFNTSYRWRVTARLASGDTVRANSAASFVIAVAGRPVATLLYQNFPNPFPRGGVVSTCIWFDLRDPAIVQLEIFDIRANLVRRLVPSPEVPTALSAGRYGRSLGNGEGGCDPRFAWDGVGEDGRLAAPGVYLLRLTANGRALTKRILFRGR
jgi:hypothetical protein